MGELLEKMANALIAGKQDEVIKLAQEALDAGTAAKEILDNGLLAGMDVVGQRFKAGDMFIPEVLLCARCMHGAMDILKPLLSESDAAGAGTYLIGTVEGDLHDIGKNLVSMMLQGAGFKVIDLGTNIKEAGIRNQVKIMAGGAPVTQDFVDKIGADAYGANAASAVEKAKELVA